MEIEDIDPEEKKRIEKQVIRNFPPGTKFVSMFGGTDVVNKSDESYVDKFGDGYVFGQHQYRLVYTHSSKSWADIITHSGLLIFLPTPSNTE